MGHEAKEPQHSDETIDSNSERKIEGPASSFKQPVDRADANRDEKIAREQPSLSPAIGLIGHWSDPIPTSTQIGDGSGNLRAQCMPPYWYLGVHQNLNQFNLPPSLFQSTTEPQQNEGSQYGQLVAIPFTPMYGMCGPSNMCHMVMPMMAMGQPMPMEGFAQPPGVSGGNTHHRGVQEPQRGGERGAHLGAPRPNNDLPQRQPNHRFVVAFQVDLLLLLKLVVVIFVFNQDGSKDRLFLLLLLAGIVYMYQTGALAPLLSWFSQLAQQAMMPPPQQLEHANVGEQGQPLGGAGGRSPVQNEGGIQGLNNNRQQPQPPHGRSWWGLFKEIQMLIVGFLTSLLPGYQHAHEG